MDQLRARAGSLKPGEAVALIAEVVRFALVGSRPADAHRPAVRAIGLKLPRPVPWSGMPAWLRRASSETDLARSVARRMVVTAMMREDGLPRPSRRSEHRIGPAGEHDRGIDPVHTPEDKERIRFVGYLGVGVGIAGRRLVPGDRCVNLSPSTAQIPFGRFDSPRRLLMAANMQVQAVRVVGGSDRGPTVRVDGPWQPPPGADLRVAYLAWKGLNHEDAWVISESAAARLAISATSVQAVPVSSVEGDPFIMVEPNCHVERGEPLLRRTISPLFLAPDMDGAVVLDPIAPDLLRMPLSPDASVKARTRGTVIRVEHWDLVTERDLPPSVAVPPGVVARYRKAVLFHIRKDLQLVVGDKLANRHGHKGIVGRIVPDEEMPQWRGCPLDALIDPISVLNRSNWGQVCETVLGAVLDGGGASAVGEGASREDLLRAALSVGCDDAGRSVVEPPVAGDGWLGRPCRAVAGVQFVMRLPKHAEESITADLSQKPAKRVLKRGRTRLGEQGAWACWAHGLALDQPPGCLLAPGMVRLNGLLEAAGTSIFLDSDANVLRVCRLPLDQLPLEARTRLELSDDRTAMQEAIIGSDPAGPPLLVLDRFVEGVCLPGTRGRAKSGVGWLPLPPPDVRPAEVGRDGVEYDHELTRLLKELVRRAVDRKRGRPYRGQASTSVLEDRLRYALAGVMRAAFALAVGTGHAGHKEACLGKEILRPKHAHTGRAVASPSGLRAGRMELGLDEVGLPPAVAAAVFSCEEIRTDADLLRISGGERPWVWIKRDPVLHRWGLLRVRARVVDGSWVAHSGHGGNTVLLSASLLRPLGADFDGDTVAVFPSLPGEQQAEKLDPPSRMGWDEVLGRAVFYPARQYVYGLHLLQRPGDRRRQLDAELQNLGGPAWPEAPSARAALEAWAGLAAQTEKPSGEWWEVIERHALLALAEDPGMGLGLVDPAVLACQESVSCGAAKKEVFDGYGPGSELFHAYRGESLSVYAEPTGPAQDTIETVMVSAAGATGRFGNVPRRFLYAARHLDTGFVRAVHALSEQAMQRTLSVKAGAPPLKFSEFEKHVLKPLLQGEQPDHEGMSQALEEFLGKDAMRRVCDRIQKNLDTEVPSWVRWLARPSCLGQLLEEVGGRFEAPLDDQRIRPFLA